MQILNAFQGVFLFIFHCAIDPKVREAYRKWGRRRAPWMFSSQASSKRGKLYLSSGDKGKTKGTSKAKTGVTNGA